MRLQHHSEFFSLSKIEQFLKMRLAKQLPGSAAHELMRAKPIGDLRPVSSKGAPRPGGVMILLYEEDGIVKFPLIKRPEYAGAHGGQVSFPGGKAETGESRMMAALREGEEEIGVLKESVRVIGQLTDFHVIPSNFLVTPVIGVLDVAPAFVPDPFEVARIIPVTLLDIARKDASKLAEITVQGTYRLNAPHFIIDGEMVWGATAMILNELRFILDELE
jgi:8-oxo-dGTP pyrophosphatase MutT (NUDIX family)